MKQVQEMPTDVGVIVGRFQVHELHEAHVDLINTVTTKHARVLIFLGLSEARCTKNNPLDYRSREVMLQEKFPDVEIHYIQDVPSDELWSKNLDGQIVKWLQPGQKATLYGSRDSFIKHYTGKLKTCELESEVFISGTQIRQEIINRVRKTADFRAGVIYATGSRYPISYQTVDVAIYDEKNRILLGRKPNEDKLRFIGGFVDPRDESLEAAAHREATEEAGMLELGPMEYVLSHRVDDWRYRSEQDKILTTLFMTKKIFGAPRPNDDICELKWVDIKDLHVNHEKIMVDTHQPMVNKLVEKLLNK